MIELRMFEMGLKRKDLATLLDTSASRTSDYLNGKREITLNVANALHQKLNIDSDIILQYITVEQLAKAFEELSLNEKTELLNLLPEDWFGIKDYKISDNQKKALDLATEKETNGNAVFHSWENVEKFVKNRNGA